MAQKITVVDDLDGTDIIPGTDSVRFAFDGQAYEIDLNDHNLAKLQAALRPFLSVARPVAAERKSTPAKSRKSDKENAAALADIRAWARRNGHEVADRGRIPAAIVAAYESGSGK